MHTEQKPVELLQAQVALYAESQNNREHPGRERELLSRLGEVGLYTTNVPDHVSYPRAHDKKQFIDGKAVTVEPAGTPLPLFDKSEYASFLKDAGNREKSRNLAEMRSNYSHVESQISDLDINDISYQAAAEHPNLLGRGSNKAAFGFRGTVNGVEKDLVALVDHAPDKRDAQSKILERAANLALVKDKPGFEQGVAWSNDPPVVVAERAPGKGMDELSKEQKAAIPASHWDGLMANAEAVAGLGIQLDAMAGNFFYDTQSGFTMIDFRRSKPGNEQADHLNNLRHIQELHDRVAVE